MRRLLDNLPIKVTSLGLAVLLWFVIAGQKTSERGIMVAVELQNFPKDLELTGDPVNSVEVRLRASPGLIQQLGPGEISAQVDLQGVREGEHIIHLTESTIRVPFGVKVVKITPAILSLDFERTLSRKVPIRPRLTGRPAPGFELAELRAEPAEVAIAGPRSNQRTNCLCLLAAFVLPARWIPHWLKWTLFSKSTPTIAQANVIMQRIS